MVMESSTGVKSAIIFPGQGSQSTDMMSVYGSHSAVADAVSEASEAIGEDLSSIIADEKLINMTVNTQPALLAVSVGVFRAAKLPTPSMMAGHSLGEYTALVCGGALEFGEAVCLSRRRGLLMQQSATGGMAAIIGELSAIEEQCESARKAGGKIWAANYNSPQQTVVAGDAAAIESCREWTKAAGIKRVVPLPVSIPSHSPLMQEAADTFMSDLQNIKWRTPNPPVIHNATLQTANADEIPQVLAAQLVRPVRWAETVSAFMESGITQIYECGPGGVLTGLAKRITDAPPHISLSNDGALSS